MPNKGGKAHPNGKPNHPGVTSFSLLVYYQKEAGLNETLTSPMYRKPSVGKANWNTDSAL